VLDAEAVAQLVGSGQTTEATPEDHGSGHVGFPRVWGVWTFR
jgi:hypothetical protein